MGLKALDLPVNGHEQVEAALGQPAPLGYSMAQLAEAAKRFGAQAVGIRTTIDELSRHRGRFVCIARLDNPGHFLIIRDVTSDMVDLVDPPNLRTCRRDIFERLWPGEALLISLSPLSIEPPAWHGWLITAAIASICVLAVALFLLIKHARRSSFAALVMAVSATGYLGCGVESNAPRPPTLPCVAAEPKAINLGRLLASSEETTRARITIRNVGTAPLRLHQVRATCGCTFVHVPRLLIEPGGKEEIVVAVKPGNEGGPRQSIVEFSSNDLSSPILEVPVRWTTVAPITVEPSSLDFGTVRPGQVPSVKLRITLSEQITGDLDIICDDEGLRWQWLDPLTNSNTDGTIRAGTLQITLAERAQRSPGYTSIVVRSARDQREVSIPVSWKLTRGLSASPAALFVSNVAAEKPARQSLVLEADDGREFAVARVLVDGREIVLDRDWQQERGRHALSLYIPVAASSGLHRGQIVVTTGCPDFSPLVIPFTLVVR